jgi:hypothetical protein
MTSTLVETSERSSHELLLQRSSGTRTGTDQSWRGERGQAPIRAGARGHACGPPSRVSSAPRQGNRCVSCTYSPCPVLPAKEIGACPVLAPPSTPQRANVSDREVAEGALKDMVPAHQCIASRAEMIARCGPTALAVDG